MARFITLAGKKQVGKDTSAQYIKQILESQEFWEPYSDQWHETAGLRPKYRVHIVHFADALKRACSEIFGIPLEDMETETGKRRSTEVCWPEDDSLMYADQAGNTPPTAWRPSGSNRFMTVREVLQFVGTELFRTQMDPDIWVKSVYRKKYCDNDIVIVADCRFPNEAEFAAKHGILINVQRDTGLENDGHASETALDDYSGYHYVIDNNGSFMDLKANLIEILKKETFL